MINEYEEFFFFCVAFLLAAFGFSHLKEEKKKVSDILTPPNYIPRLYHNIDIVA